MANTLDSIIDYLADAVVKDANGDATVNDLKLQLDTTAAAGTPDGDFYAAIVALGWESDVISGGVVDVKKLLTKISKQMKEEFVYQDYSCPAVSITAGGIGTYATGANVDITKSGYEVVSASAMTVGHSANYNFLYFIYNKKIYFTFYRVNSTAYSIPNGDIVIRVLYKKVSGGNA